ncbi:MAG: hypothetical protein ABID38_04995, partial [Candidatus Diapherotrites archaeon]
GKLEIKLPKIDAKEIEIVKQIFGKAVKDNVKDVKEVKFSEKKGKEAKADKKAEKAGKKGK